MLQDFASQHENVHTQLATKAEIASDPKILIDKSDKDYMTWSMFEDKLAQESTTPTTTVSESQPEEPSLDEQIEALMKRGKEARDVYALSGRINTFNQNTIDDAGKNAVSKANRKMSGDKRLPPDPVNATLSKFTNDDTKGRLLQALEKAVPAMERKRQEMDRDWQPNLPSEGQSR